jgi:hypothetical protein
MRKPIDVITSAYLLLAAGLAAAWHARLPDAFWLAPLLLASAVAVLFLPPYLRRTGNAFACFVAAGYPVVAFTFLYLGTSLFNAASPIPSLDPWLAGIDDNLFGGSLCDRFSAAYPHPVFAEIMAFFYFSYYLMIPGLGLLLWFRVRPLFDSFVFTTALCFYFFYLVFSLFPSAGPQFHLRGGALHWEGYLFGPLLTTILQNVEVPTGAFPSSHVGVALIATCFAWRTSRGLGGLFTVLCTGLSLAILYGGPHYFLDLPCGLAVGAFFYCAAPRVAVALTKRLDEEPGSMLT